MQACAEAVELPNIQSTQTSQNPPEPEVIVDRATHPETPSTTQPPSEEAASTTPTTPSSVQPGSHLSVKPATPTQVKQPPKHSAAIPVLPIVPIPTSRILPTTAIAEQTAPESNETEPASNSIQSLSTNLVQTSPNSDAQISEAQNVVPSEDVEAIQTSPLAVAHPKLWTGLFKAPATTPTIATNGTPSNLSAATSASILSKSNSESVADALRTFSASTHDAKLAFIKPRGLVNTGNMCYMSSVSPY